MPLVRGLPWKAWYWRFKIIEMKTPPVDFATRSEGIEIMDDLACNGEVVYQTLRELDVINHWLGGNAVTISAVKSVWKSLPEKKLSVADIGCGSGEMLRILARLARKKNRSVSFFGCDANPHITSYASQHSTEFPEISYEEVDVFSKEFQALKFDIVLATLFFHHFTETQLVELFRSLNQQTRCAIIVNDIHRHPLAYHSIRYLTRWFSKSSMVQFDAPLSVLRSFKKKELIGILAEAGIKTYILRWKWAFRWQLVISTQPS